MKHHYTIEHAAIESYSEFIHGDHNYYQSNPLVREILERIAAAKPSKRTLRDMVAPGILKKDKRHVGMNLTILRDEQLFYALEGSKLIAVYRVIKPQSDERRSRKP